MKRGILAVIAVFVAWAVLDFILHGLLLQATYEATASLWRPMEEMNMPAMYLVLLVSTICFVAIYAYLATTKSVLKGTVYGLLFGLATGVGMGFGSYCYLPIPMSLAMAWFIGTIVEGTIAGAIIGAILK